jgi:hypothetical protein
VTALPPRPDCAHGSWEDTFRPTSSAQFRWLQCPLVGHYGPKLPRRQEPLWIGSRPSLQRILLLCSPPSR